MLISKQHDLGMIPAWQLSTDPSININLNPHVQYPEGMNQLTVQPIGPGMGPNLRGIDLFDSWAWNNRKWLVLGGGALLGLALLSGVTAILR